MTHKYLLFFTLLTLTSFHYSSQVMAKDSVEKSSQPNIIFILTDDQRWDTLGYAGNNIIHTPSMDQLAKEGVFFNNAFVTTPICAASRASIMTGQYERKHGFTFNTPPLATSKISQSYPKVLKDNGYTTGFVGKFGMQYEDDLQKEVFDFFEPLGEVTPGGRYYELNLDTHMHEHLTKRIGDTSIKFISQHTNKDTPFNLSVSFHAPHADDHDPNQFIYPRDLDYLYKDATIPQPDLIDDQYYAVLPEWVKDSISKKRWKWRFDTPEKYQNMVKGYYRMISGVDREIGKIRSYLETAGLADNTIIIVMGDNGYFLGERKIAGKWLMYENSLRVPLIVFDPRNKQHQDLQKMVLNIDIAPTILSYAGIKPPTSIQGKPLQQLMDNKDKDWRTEFLSEHLMETDWIPKSEGIRTENYKYFRYLDHPDHHELYDLKNDPLETNNLALSEDNQQLLEVMINKTNAFIESVK